MPQYLLSVCHDDDYDDLDYDSAETRAQMARTGALTEEMKRAGAWVFVAGLLLEAESRPHLGAAQGRDGRRRLAPVGEHGEKLPCRGRDLSGRLRERVAGSSGRLA